MYDLSANREHVVNSGHKELIRAIFCDEFEEGVDDDALSMIGDGNVGRWVSVLRSTGLFQPGEVDAIERQWTADPATLVAALLGGTDEVSRRRAANVVSHEVPIGHAAVG